MPATLALEGGTPVRGRTLPYGRQSIDEADIRAVVHVLRSDWLTTGPMVSAFEDELSGLTGCATAVAVNSGTAALHAAVHGLGISPGDEVIVPAMTFAATANCVVYCGGTPVFADVDPGTLLIDPTDVEARITKRTRAIIAVDYAGQPCDYPALKRIADRHGLTGVIADASHSLGGALGGTPVGALADLSTFSFHPVKHVTTGEGGAVVTDDAELARRMRLFRNHGITSDHRQRDETGSWFYEIQDLGFNYRISDIHCALGISQLRRLHDWILRRQEIAARYDRELEEFPEARPLTVREGVSHAFHLYVLRLNLDRLKVDRTAVFAALRAEGIGLNVHYIPVHLHPFYRERFGTAPGLFPRAEAAYERIVSIPIFPAMSDGDVQDVIEAVGKVLNAYGG